MKTKIALDLKSVILGAAASAVLIFGVGATTPGSPSPVGRYQVAVGGNGMAAIVDTTTGQAYTVQIQTPDIQANQTEAIKSFNAPKN